MNAGRKLWQITHSLGEAHDQFFRLSHCCLFIWRVSESLDLSSFSRGGYKCPHVAVSPNQATCYILAVTFHCKTKMGIYFYI